jgi:transaldolase/glucose-6-phosphate isomerase
MKRTHLATTIGFGPRFLHSTGQLHKGGPNNGLFIQITADPVEDVIIPEEGITFATLERAQALGDLESLIARGRRVVRVHLSNPQLLMKVAEIFK